MVGICIFRYRLTQINNSIEFHESPGSPTVRAFSGDFIRFQAKMHPLWTITGKRPGCRHKFVIIQLLA